MDVGAYVMAVERNLLVIEGKVTGQKKLSRLMSFAPEVYKRRLKHQLRIEHESFIGKRGKPGLFRRKLLRKRLSGGRKSRRGGPGWSSQVIGLFTGRVFGSIYGTMDIGMVLGSDPKRKRQIHKALELLGEGGSISNSKEMIVPVYDNLRSVGISPKTMTGGRSKLDFYRRQRGALVRLTTGSFTKYYDAQLLKAGDNVHALMFLGLHKVRIKRQFNFAADWKRREPKAISRLQKAVDRGTKDINRGKIK